MSTTTLAPGIEPRRFTHRYFRADAWLAADAEHAVLIDAASNGDAGAGFQLHMTATSPVRGAK